VLVLPRLKHVLGRWIFPGTVSAFLGNGGVFPRSKNAPRNNSGIMAIPRNLPKLCDVPHEGSSSNN
jgi:hypothetical protein